MIPQSYREICFAYTNNPPRKYQEIAWEGFLGNIEQKKATLVRLPCGYGKTLIGLIPFIAQAADNDWKIAPRLIYVLPMRSLANEVRGKAKEVVEKTKIKFPLVIKTLHGEAWDTPHLFADVCVTTLDSFLYSYARKASVESTYANRHVDFTAGSIANSMVVFDEAHMYQGGEIQVLALFSMVVKFLVKTGVPVLIMTATMPKVIIDFIFKEIAYSDISFKDDEKLFDKRYEMLPPNPNDLLNVDIRGVISSLNFKKLLIVTNTVERAIRICEELRDHDPILLHARIRNADKITRLEEVKSRLNKGHVVLVSTQVCEAGLDLNFDALITDIAPADSLIQRIGRVARRGGKGTIMMFKPETFAPYEYSVVRTTWNWVNAHFTELDLTRFSSCDGICGVEKFVDDCWEPYSKEFERFPSESELFLMGKGLISEPDLDFDVRGTKYVVMVAPYDREKTLLNGDIIKKDEFDRCKFVVDLDMVKRHTIWIKHENNQEAPFIVLKYDRKKQGYAAHRSSEIKAYQAYLCNDSCYSQELGLVGGGECHGRD